MSQFIVLRDFRLSTFKYGVKRFEKAIMFPISVLDYLDNSEFLSYDTAKTKAEILQRGGSIMIINNIHDLVRARLFGISEPIQSYIRTDPPVPIAPIFAWSSFIPTTTNRYP